jgi:hypothetical protein
MRSLSFGIFVVACLAGSSSSAIADSTMRQLRKFEGYTVIAVTAVDGEFQGCDFGRVIKLQNGNVFKCSSYGYTYAYSPDAAVFAKVISFQGKSIATVKLLVEGEIFDMEPVILK